MVAAFTHVLHPGESDEVLREVPDVRGDLGGGIRNQRVEPALPERRPHAVMPARQLLTSVIAMGLPPLATRCVHLARNHKSDAEQRLIAGARADLAFYRMDPFIRSVGGDRHDEDRVGGRGRVRLALRLLAARSEGA